jgi:ABC-2 type transport system ATP-binding protein
MGVIDLDQLEVRLANRTHTQRADRRVAAATLIGLLGPNGAGKSTLINTLLGFHAPSKGTARVFGLDSHRDRAPDPRRHRLHAGK